MCGANVFLPSSFTPIKKTNFLVLVLKLLETSLNLIFGLYFSNLLIFVIIKGLKIPPPPSQFVSNYMDPQNTMNWIIRQLDGLLNEYGPSNTPHKNTPQWHVTTLCEESPSAHVLMIKYCPTQLDVSFIIQVKLQSFLNGHTFSLCCVANQIYNS